MSGFNINRIILSGNLTRDPELRTIASGVAVCNLRLANNTRRKDANGEWEDKPNYFDVTVWRGMGEWVARSLGRGDSVVVEGVIEWREWEDKEGNKRQSYDVTADSIIPTGERSGGGNAPTPRQEVPADTADLAPASVPVASNPADDDIPF